MKKYTIPMSRPNLGKKEWDSVMRVLKSNWPSQGNVTKKFENLISKYLESNCVVVNNGSSALMAALIVHGLKPKDKVLVPAFTFVASSSVPKMLGAEIVIADIDPNTFNITPEIIEKSVKKQNIKFVIVVDIGGLSVDIDAIRKLSKEYNFILIEDAAQSFGGKYKNKNIGCFDHLTAFSFQIAKQLTTIEGGCIASTNSTLLKKIDRIKDYGRSTKEMYVHDFVGSNFRTTDIQSAIGIEQFKKVEKHIERRNKIAKIYKKEFSSLDFQDIPSYITRHSFMLFFVKTTSKKQRDECVKFLNKNGIDARKSWKPIHMQPCNKELSKFRCINAEKIYEQVFTLPIFNGMTNQEVEKVITKFGKFLK
ncbi:DegT/DnrJ/EryC1/StrS family aminotransferase [Nitrosopumilus sp. S4]